MAPVRRIRLAGVFSCLFHPSSVHDGNPMAVYLLATLDTKAADAEFVRNQLQALDMECLLVDTGCLGNSQLEADISREEVFAAAGTSLEEMQQKGDRGCAVTAAARGATGIIQRLHEQGKLQGVIGLGGSTDGEKRGVVQTWEGSKDPRGYTPFVQAAVKACAESESPPISNAHSLRALKTVFSIYEAAETGKSVTITQ